MGYLVGSQHTNIVSEQNVDGYHRHSQLHCLTLQKFIDDLLHDCNEINSCMHDSAQPILLDLDVLRFGLDDCHLNQLRVLLDTLLIGVEVTISEEGSIDLLVERNVVHPTFRVHYKLFLHTNSITNQPYFRIFSASPINRKINIIRQNE